MSFPIYSKQRKPHNVPALVVRWEKPRLSSGTTCSLSSSNVRSWVKDLID